MKIPFSIKFKPQIESGEYKVVTSFGEPAEIVKWDCKGQYPLLACIFDGDTDDAAFYTEEGKGVCNSKENYLSIITPEQELSEFEQALLGAFEDIWEGPVPEERAKSYAPKLLELARKELEPEVLERLEIAYKNQDEVVYENGKREGKAETLKDLPRWKKCEHEMHTLTNLLIRSIDAMWIGAYVKEGQYYIPTNDLILKLPGFKED